MTPPHFAYLYISIYIYTYICWTITICGFENVSEGYFCQLLRELLQSALYVAKFYSMSAKKTKTRTAISWVAIQIYEHDVLDVRCKMKMMAITDTSDE